MKPTKIRINKSSYSFEEIINNENIRVISFLYNIPRPIFPPVQRISKLNFVKSIDEKRSLKRTLNLINLLFCWVGLPLGPSYAISAIKANKKGIDFTEDVKLNLKKDDFEKGYVIIEKTEKIFEHPDKDTTYELKKCLKKLLKKNNIQFKNEIYVGLNIETSSSTHYIGLIDSDYGLKDELEKAIKKRFYSHVSFNYINLNEESEFNNKLIRQGLKLTAANKS